MYHKIYEAIASAPVITIFRHQKPDGDAYGSQMGLKELILDNFPNKTVYVLGEQNNHWGKLLGLMDENISDDVIASSLAIVLDVGDKPRVDDPRCFTAKNIIKIDHHIFTEDFGGLELIQTSFIATAEILTEWAMQNKLEISKTAATALYCGLVMDSGRFQYQNTTPDTFRRAAVLLDTGVDMTALYNYVYEVSETDVRYTGYCRLNYQTTPHGVAYIFITKDVRKQFGIGENQGAGSVNALANIKDINMHVFFVEKEDGTIKIEFRSKQFSVNGVAVKYGGGGHKLASGAIVKSWDEAQLVLNDLDKVCEDELSAL